MSEHFTEKELECKCGCGLNNCTDELIQLAESVRAVLNRPMIVHSCCRCRAHNEAVGGKPTSKHLTGQAMDFHVEELTPEEVYETIINANLKLLGGIGLYSWGVHIDTAKTDHLRTWRG